MNQQSSDGNEMRIAKIKDGTVIDHIPSELCFNLVKVLGLQDHGHVVSSATNLPSSKMGSKGIIKISSKYLTEEEVSKISVVAPNVTLSTIKDYNVEKKVKLSTPHVLKNIVQCNNPNCITNVEKVDTCFHVAEDEPLTIKCMYCERTIGKNDIKLL